MKSRLKEVPVGEAVGLVLAHDLTVIDPGKYKGPRFRKGHRIREEDIEELLRIGKEHVYVLELAEGELHEDEAAERIARSAAGPHLARTEPKEGKVNLVAEVQGLLRIDVEAVTAINRVEQVALSTLRTYTPVEKGQTVAATRVIPLVFPEASIREVEKIAAGRERPVVEVVPFRPHRVGVVTTGSEVYHGRIRRPFWAGCAGKGGEVRIDGGGPNLRHRRQGDDPGSDPGLRGSRGGHGPGDQRNVRRSR